MTELCVQVMITDVRLHVHVKVYFACLKNKCFFFCCVFVSEL